MNFDEANRLFRDGKISQLAASNSGRRFLKLKSLSRKPYLLRLFEEMNQTPAGNNAKDIFKEAFNSKWAEKDIDKVINIIDAEQRRDRNRHREQIINQLYKLKSFDWGGSSSIEKKIVDRYVKKIWDFGTLEQAIEGDLHQSMRGYVLCSWYNHWSSLLIEDIFRDHEAVLPAIGLVKQIDFFVCSIPFDLKVTYLPEGFVVSSRKDRGLRQELPLLKRSAKDNGIPINQDLNAREMLEDLWVKHEESSCQSAVGLVDDLRGFRGELVREALSDATLLIRWLYENQGERRFDASNRLFLILIDPKDYFASWKLKRSFQLLENEITAYLNSASKGSVGSAITFQWKGENYKARSDAIIISKSEPIR